MNKAAAFAAFWGILCVTVTSILREQIEIYKSATSFRVHVLTLNGNVNIALCEFIVLF